MAGRAGPSGAPPIDLPLIGRLDPSALSLPLITVVLAGLDASIPARSSCCCSCWPDGTCPEPHAHGVGRRGVRVVLGPALFCVHGGMAKPLPYPGLPAAGHG